MVRETELKNAGRDAFSFGYAVREFMTKRCYEMMDGHEAYDTSVASLKLGVPNKMMTAGACPAKMRSKS